MACKGTGTLRMFAEKAKGRINIIAGGGVRFDNIGHLCGTSRAHWYHSSALGEDSVVPDAEEIKRMLEIVDWRGVKAREMKTDEEQPPL